MHTQIQAGSRSSDEEYAAACDENTELLAAGLALYNHVSPQQTADLNPSYLTGKPGSEKSVVFTVFMFRNVRITAGLCMRCLKNKSIIDT